MELYEVTISENVAADYSAGIGNYGGSMILQNATISNNVQERDDYKGPGGIGNWGNMTLINVTVSGNEASLYGGGIYNSGNGHMVLNNVTVYNNSLRQQAPWYPDPGAGIENYGIMEVRNTIIAGNFQGNDCSGDITSLGHNLDSDESCKFALSGINPMLGPLQNNGGFTHTHALLQGSPAIDAGSGTNFPTADQRGVTRPQDGDGDGTAIGDIGAYEVEGSTAISVFIDIKPGSYANCFNINGHGIIPVAILGSKDLDVSAVNSTTLSFAGLYVRVRGNKGPLCHIEDVSGDFTNPEGAPDGYLDLVCQFEDDPDAWEPGDCEAELTGALFGETPIAGSNQICIKPE